MQACKSLRQWDKYSKIGRTPGGGLHGLKIEVVPQPCRFARLHGLLGGGKRGGREKEEK
jgi:hypothetical protein